MIARTARLAGLGAALAATLAGCGPTAAGSASSAAASPAPAASPTDSRTPLQILASAVPGEKSAAYRYSVKGVDSPMSGVIDATKKAAEFDVVQHNENPTFTMSMTVLLTADKSWAKVVFTPALGGLPRMPKKWMIVDPSKIKDKSGSPFVYGEESDPGYTNEVFEFATNVTRSSPGRFSGVSDLSDTSDDILPAGWLKALGGKATAIPFTAVVDGQGRLTSVAVKIPSAGKYKAATYQVTYDRYGATATPTAPAAADQTKAPASFYSLFED